MSIQDILNSGSKSSKAAAPAIPQGGGYSKSDVKLAGDMQNRMTQIEKLVKSSNKHWGKMAEARPLIKAQASMKAFNLAQIEHDSIMKSSTATIMEKVVAYNKLAKARKDAIDDTREYNKVLNEQKGAAGRALNVLQELPLVGMALAAAGNAVKIAFGQAADGFGAMARSGQVAGKSMGDLAKSTGMFVVEMNLASVSAAQFGIVPEESNKSFLQLTETFGGTEKAVSTLGAQWDSLAQLAAVSGIGMTAMSDLVAENFKKVGGTMEEALKAAKTQVAEMSTVTAELNARFGAGSVNTAAFASAINDLAFGSSFANQNSRMLTETLGRELQMQLALGKAPEAAMAAATKNIEMAGKVNIIGIQDFRQQMQEGYEAAQKEGKGAEYLADLGKKFGSQGEIIGNMLEEKTLMDSDNLFAFQEAVDQSTGLRTAMLDDMRSAAASGDIGKLLEKGLGIREAQYMVAEANLLTTKIGKLSGGDAEANKAAREDLLGADAFDEEGKAKEADVQAFLDAQASGESSASELQMMFRALPGAELPEAEIEADFLKDTIGAGWFFGISKMFETIPGLMKTAVGGIVAAIGALGLKLIAAKALGGGGLPGMGGKFAGMGGKFLKGGLVGAAVGVGVAGFANAASRINEKKAAGESFTGTEEGEGGFLGSRAAGIGQATASGALVGAAIGSVIPVVGTLVGGLVGAGIGALASIITDVATDNPEEAAAALEIATMEAAGEVPTPSAAAPVEDGPVDARGKDQSAGGGAAVATGAVSGGSLILEVQNWDSVYAESLHNAS
jgi:hypothetical protein